jgi:hypothetical protein
MNPEVLRTTITAIKKGFSQQPWWNYVQEEVKASLIWIVENIDSLGFSFQECFIALCKWENRRRIVRGIQPDKSVVFKQAADSLLGKAMSQECYEAGKLPCKSVLNLNDYIDPNYADVQFCFSLCHQISALVKLGLIVAENTEVTDMGQIFSQIKGAKEQDKDFTTIFWDFHNGF